MPVLPAGIDRFRKTPSPSSSVSQTAGRRSGQTLALQHTGLSRTSCAEAPSLSTSALGSSSHERRACPLRRRCSKGPTIAQAQSTSSGEAAGPPLELAAAQTADGSVRVSLPTSEMLTSIEMGRRADGRIVIESVAPDSDMAQAGVRPGTLLTAIADPVRRGTMWPLDGRSSLRMVLYTLRFQHGPQVEVDLLLPGSDSLTEAQREAQSKADERARASQDQARALKRRQQRREEYMARSQEGGSNGPLLAFVAAIVILPPLLILIYALQSGYLDQLGSAYRGRY